MRRFTEKWTNSIHNKKRAVDREKNEIVISLLSLSNAHDVPWSAHCNLQSYVLHRRCKYTCTHVYIASQTPNNCFVNRPAMSSVAIIRAPDYSSFRLLSTVSNNYCVRLFMNAVANVFILIISFSCSRLYTASYRLVTGADDSKQAGQRRLLLIGTTTPPDTACEIETHTKYGTNLNKCHIILGEFFLFLHFYVKQDFLYDRWLNNLVL